MERFSVFVLSGGKSQRFGSDKARAELEGEALLCRAAKAAASVAERVTVIAEKADEYADLGFPTLGDVIPQRGPLGGLLTALENTDPDGWALVLTCDLMVFESAWVELLAAGRSDVRAVAFRNDRWQPFPGLYHASLREDARQAIGASQLSMWRFLDQVGARALPVPASWPPVPQANTPEDLRRFQRSSP
jgi:molybdopterin-guanine dinucleotide biosynthesis protein A